MSTSVMKTFAVAALAITSSAHMIMRSPQPFINSVTDGSGSLMNSPLEDDASNYPCHMAGDYSTDQWASMEQGSSQVLSFTGSAVHGGGSCQVSITYDLEPSKSSVFKVIHSIQGGCPARNTVGNLAGGASLLTPDEYDFSIPADLPVGKAVLAWTWFNRVGNREMYMNCAPVEITGASGAVSSFNVLPDIMVANIGDDSCFVNEGTDVAFPNPGTSVENNSSGELQDVSDQPACSFNNIAGSGQGSIGSPTETEEPEEVDTPSPTVPGNVFITAAPEDDSVIPEESETATPEVPEATPAPVEEEEEEEISIPVGEEEQEDDSTCTDGFFKCSDNTYAQCSFGVWTVSRPLAPGTSCAPGVGPSLIIMSTKTRRNHPRSFVLSA